MERGWPCDVPRECESYTRRKDELSVQYGVFMWGARVIVPPKGPDTLLKEGHVTHPGIVKMKALARSYIWWAGLAAEIGMCIMDCTTCQLHSKQSPVASLHPCEWPGRMWHRRESSYIMSCFVSAHGRYTIVFHPCESFIRSRAFLVLFRSSIRSHVSQEIHLSPLDPHLFPQYM